MKDYFKELFSKPEGKSAREMYYLQVKNQLLAGDQLAIFMREARRRGFIMKLHIEVDGVFCPSGEIIMERLQGKELGEYIANWTLGMRFVYQTEIEEMERLWPELRIGEVKEILNNLASLSGGAGNIAPEGP